jgi:hypothetical protein
MLYSSHPDLHLTARDRVSFSFLSQHFNKTKHHLSPDAAFAIGPVTANCEPTLDVVFLLRADTEKRKPKEEEEGEEQAFEMLREAGLSFLRTDWNCRNSPHFTSLFSPMHLHFLSKPSGSSTALLFQQEVKVQYRIIASTQTSSSKQHPLSR